MGVQSQLVKSSGSTPETCLARMGEKLSEL